MYDQLKNKIRTLNELMWQNKLLWEDVEVWLASFRKGTKGDTADKLHALFLLSNFTYFNSSLMRELLRALFRDLIQYRIVERIRQEHGNVSTWASIAPEYERALNRVRFIGIGNPSESGTHLLYYFRQENRLPKKLFVHPYELFEGPLASPRLIGGVDQIVFLDDFCGSGTQATRYSKHILARIRELNKIVTLSYFPLFGVISGIDKVRKRTKFDVVEALCELDSSFRSLEDSSRYFRERLEGISIDHARDMCSHYGAELEPSAPLGFGDSQLLLGFAHNIPDNTLPIFWSDGSEKLAWAPIFPRYAKGELW